MSLVVYAWAEDTCEVEEFELEVIADPTDWTATMREALTLLSEDLDADEDLEVTNLRASADAEGVVSGRIETALPSEGASSVWHLYFCPSDCDAAGELADAECEAHGNGKSGEDEDLEPVQDEEDYEENDEDLESDEAVGDD